MRNKGKLYGIICIFMLAFGLFLFTGSAAAVETQSGKELERHSLGDIFFRSALFSLQKPLPEAKIPAERKSISMSLPATKKLPDSELKKFALSDFLEMRRAVLKRPAHIQKSIPQMRKLAENDLGGIVAGSYHFQNVVMGEAAELWVKIPRKTYTDFHTDPKTPWLDVMPHTWFMINHSRINLTYYKWWEDTYKGYETHWEDIEFNVHGTYLSNVREFKNPDHHVLRYKTHVLEMRFNPARYEYANTKIATDGGKVYRTRNVSDDMRIGYVIFFE